MIAKRQACVIGWPIDHSRSPLLHGFWLEKYGIPGRYDRIPVRPEDLSDFLHGFRARGLVGGNVTLPHKEAVFRQVTVRDPLTAKLGAVNTLYFEDDTLCGTSTDGYGFVASIEQEVPDFTFSGARVTILGAGGASRSIIGVILEAGAQKISVANRSLARAEQLRSDFGPQVIPMEWGRAEDVLPGTDLLVNTTSLGMAGKAPLTIDLAGLPGHAVVSDIVYVPLTTPLLTAARARNLRTVDGLGMLMHQAVPGFERWFGIRPEVTPELRALLEADIEGRRL
ncbi:shikimate dehydrogenase [Rhodoligotrophos defluvii]|uniref:shikimate dehydrogenase n=1 Tax=Rhodoligotrophos defluvii TaxID=2561934 RepID=UPI0010C9E6C3|nr:shikimate dehydrogenase [Rhodoligotrophos defluvii]